MHYIYSQSLVVGALIKAWDSFLLEPRNSPLCCSDFLVIGRQACTSKGIPLPSFSSDVKGELDEIILCSAEIVVANLNQIKLNTCSDAVNNIYSLEIELDHQGLEIMSDGLRLLRRDMEGLRCHYLSQMWQEQNKLNEAYEHVDIMLGFIDQALHGDADALSYQSLLERYTRVHAQDHFGQAHINFYAVDSDPKGVSELLETEVKPEAVASAVIFDGGEQTVALHNESVFALHDGSQPSGINQAEQGLQTPCPPEYSSITQETHNSFAPQNNEQQWASIELSSNQASASNSANASAHSSAHTNDSASAADSARTTDSIADSVADSARQEAINVVSGDSVSNSALSSFNEINCLEPTVIPEDQSSLEPNYGYEHNSLDIQASSPYKAEAQAEVKAVANTDDSVDANINAGASTQGVAQAASVAEAGAVAASEVVAKGECEALDEGKNSQGSHGSHEQGLYGFNGETIHEDLGSLNGVPLYTSEKEEGNIYKEDLPEDMARRIQDKNKQEYMEYENTFADSELKPQDDYGKHHSSFSSFVLKYSKPQENSGEVKPKAKVSLLYRLFSKDLYNKILRTAPSVKVRYISSFVLTLLVIVGLFFGIWGGIYSMSYVKLSSLGTLAQAKIVAIEDDYVHKKESRNLDRVEHHFIEIVEFKLDDGSTLRTPLYLNGNRDSTDVRPVGTAITILYKNDDPHSLIDAKSITPFFTSVFMTVIGVVFAAAGIFFLGVLNLRFFRHYKDSAIQSGVLSLVLITTSLVFISKHFENSLHWLYSAASEDEVYYNDLEQLLVDKKSNKPYSGLVRTFHNGIYTISEYDNGLKDGTEYIYVAAEPVGYFNYSSGKLDGDYQSIDEYGRLDSRGTYRSGHLDGSWVKYEAVKGKIAAKGQWLWGAKEGTWTFYRADGSKYCVEHYSQDLLNGMYYEYGPLGQLILKTKYVKDVAHGQITRYWPHGTKLYQATLENGIANGLFNAYYADGTIFVSGTMKYGRWYTPPRVFNHRGIELDSAQKRLYRKSKDKQISTIKRAIALDYNLTFDEVGLATSMYKFRIGSDAFNQIDYDLASEYTKTQVTQEFNYFKVPEDSSANSDDDLPLQRNYSAIRAKGGVDITPPKELLTDEINPSQAPKQNQETRDPLSSYTQADPFSTDNDSILKDVDINSVNLNSWYSNNPNYDALVINDVNNAPKVNAINGKQQPEARDQVAENKPSESYLNVRSNVSHFSESYNLLQGPISDLDREIHESLLQAEALGQCQSLSQSLALNSNVNNEVGLKDTYNARHQNIRMPANSKEEMSIRDYALSHPERSVNTNINVDKVAQSWALRNLSDYSYSLNNSFDKLPSLLETNPGAITWSHESLRQPPANRPINADAINNKLVPFDHAIKGLLLMALHNWVGESVISIPGVDVPVKDLVQYGDGVYSDTSFAWMRYPDNFIITVAISKPQLQPNAVVVRGFENSALRFDPYQVIYRTKRSFMANHKKVQPFVISVTYQYSAK